MHHACGRISAVRCISTDTTVRQQVKLAHQVIIVSSQLHQLITTTNLYSRLGGQDKMWKARQKDELRQQMKLHLEMHASLAPIKTVPYGTAGFRGSAKQIGWIFYRAGIMAALRCFDVRQAIGIMITASHNPIDDNGIKFIDDNGLMLASAWELIVDELCNIKDIDTFIEALDEVVKKHKVYCDVRPTRAQIFIGFDTRPSSEYLANLVLEGIRAMAGTLIPVTEMKLCTTPELHWLVAEANKQCVNTEPQIRKDTYWERLVAGLMMGFQVVNPASRAGGSGRDQNVFYNKRSLVVDCANGVGCEIMKQVQRFLKSTLPLGLINVGEGVLNESCGADYVKTQLKPVTHGYQLDRRYASLDGDADRLVYYYLIENTRGERELKLLDGDRIQVLYAAYMAKILLKSRYNGLLSIACIQTAYANGACTDFLKKTGFRVDCTDTGVKNLHRQAMKYDIGIYFEANGHGTIHLSQRARDLFTGHIKDPDSAHDPTWQPTELEESENHIFRVTEALLNIYVGDGVADLLLVEHILKFFDWNIDRWYQLYADRPNRLIKLRVKDKTLIKTVEAGRKCCSPPGLQADIDAILAGFGPHARSFVRPSGTEDVVRVYAEADTQEVADEIADMVGRKTVEYCDTGEEQDKFTLIL